jgi:hypothetical protein
MAHKNSQDAHWHRGVLHNPEVRYRQDSVQAEDNGWFSEDIQPSPATQNIVDRSRSRGCNKTLFDYQKKTRQRIFFAMVLILQNSITFFEINFKIS